MAERPAASLWHGTTRRVEKELRDLPANPDVSSAGPILSIGPIGEDIMHWQATLAGPPGSPYQGGTFHLDIKIPNQYPWQPPAVAFVTRIFHPNVVQSLRRGFDGVGAISIYGVGANFRVGVRFEGNFLSSGWSPALTVATTVMCIVSLMRTPCADVINVVRSDAGHAFLYERDKYMREARRWTIAYAGGAVPERPTLFQLAAAKLKSAKHVPDGLRERVNDARLELGIADLPFKVAGRKRPRASEIERLFR